MGMPPGCHGNVTGLSRDAIGVPWGTTVVLPWLHGSAMGLTWDWHGTSMENEISLCIVADCTAGSESPQPD